MANPIDVSFRNGFGVDADKLTAIVKGVNDLIAEHNSLLDNYSQINKSQTLVIARKTTIQTITTQGQNNTIENWTSDLNRGSVLNATTGLITVPQTANHRIGLKTFISVNTATRIRAKLSIIASGTELSKCEQNSYGTSGNISNYRINLATDVTMNLGQGVVITPRLQVWDATSGQILNENSADTLFTLERIY